MRTDAEVRRAAERLAWLGFVGNKQVGAWVGKLDHGFKKGGTAGKHRLAKSIRLAKFRQPPVLAG